MYGPNSRQNLKHAAIGFAAFLLVYAYLLRGIVLGHLYTFGDFPPFYGRRAFETFLDVWHFKLLGYSYINNAMPAYFGAVTLAGGPLAQNLVFLALIPAGFLTFHVFAARFVDSEPALLLAAGVYALNPITIGEFVNGGVGALIGFVGLPLVLHFLYRIVEGGGWPDALKAGAAFGATTIYPWLAFWMVAPFAIHLAYRARKSPTTLARLVASGAIGVVLALPGVHHVLQRAVSFSAVEGVFFRQVSWNYARADVLSVARLAGNHGTWAMNGLEYNTDPMMAVGLVIPAMAMLAWGRERLHVFYGIAGLCVAFMVATKHGLTYPLFEVFPPLWTLRNPVKLQYPLLLSVGVLFGAGVETALFGSRPELGTPLSSRGYDELTMSPTRIALVGLLAFSLVLYSIPASGALGLETMRGDEYYISQEQQRIEDQVEGKVLWVPYGYTTQLQLRHTYPNHVGIKSGGVVQGIQNTEFVATLFRDFATSPSSAHARLTRLGVQYVVVDGDPPSRAGNGEPHLEQKWGAPWLVGTPETFRDRLRAASEYSKAFSTAEYTVYRVEGVTSKGQIEETTGLHSVVYPTDTDVERVGDSVMANGDFERGLEDWWAYAGENGTRSTVVNTSDGERAVRMVTETGKRYPVAQLVPVEKGHPYELDADAQGQAFVTLYWYDGEKSKENFVAQERYRVDEVPTTVIARGDRVSVRVLPNATEVLVERVSLTLTTYPARTGFSANIEGVPGVVVDGRSEYAPNDTVVAVNLDESETQAAEADVRLVDAETTIDGELAFDDRYRQGVGIVVEDGDLPAVVPDDARPVVYDTSNGAVLDYWVTGEFDDRSVTVLRTSYDERWVGSTDGQHFRAYGWANGFTDTTPDEIRWTGNDRLREGVVAVWLLAWLLTLLALTVHVVRKRSRRSVRP